MSEWLPVKASSPQRSILGLLFFPIYINDLPFDTVSPAKLFADEIHSSSLLKNKDFTMQKMSFDKVLINSLTKLFIQGKWQNNISYKSISTRKSVWRIRFVQCFCSNTQVNVSSPLEHTDIPSLVIPSETNDSNAFV